MDHRALSADDRWTVLSLDHTPSRRQFLRSLGLGLAGLSLQGSVLTTAVASGARPSKKNLPNVIFCMADDLGWGDTGYNGHPRIQTPYLDQMAREGLCFDRFYSGAPVCSPTRGSVLTGRHPQRLGIRWANDGRIGSEEITLAELVKEEGYTTGHFGKWHLGTLTTELTDSNRGRPGNEEEYSPPWENGFDVCFSTEAKVPTWDPMKKPEGEAPKQGWTPLDEDAPSEPYGTRYWEGPGQIAGDNLEGDDSRVIMDRAVGFIEEAVTRDTPFFAVIWFHAPHLPVVAGPKTTASYLDLDPYTKNYYGCITALDQQMGRLRETLARLGVGHETLLWFCSDNGPEGKEGQAPGSAGPFRGRKRSLYEGGVRVPGLLVWPDKIPSGRKTDLPCVTSDLFPTVLDVVGEKLPSDRRPYDGISLLSLVEGRLKKRPSPIAFESRDQLSLTDNQYKLYSKDDGDTFELYDLIEDPGETRDLADTHPKIVQRMQNTLETWRHSCRDDPVS